MWETLILGGLALIGASIVGGGIKLFNVEVPALASVPRQKMLAAFGTIVAGIGFGALVLNANGGGVKAVDPATPSPTPAVTPTSPAVPATPGPAATSSAPAATPTPTQPESDAGDGREEVGEVRSAPGGIPQRLDGTWTDAQGGTVTILSGPNGGFSWSRPGMGEFVRAPWRTEGTAMIVFVAGQPGNHICELNVSGDGQAMSGICSVPGVGTGRVDFYR